MSYEAILLSILLVITVVFVIAIFRNRNTPGANQKIVQINERIAENQERIIASSERSAEAMERIAEALEKR